ncbi:MAG: hypothetical protein FJ291_22960 [Planctomycetes bacterium]|nr:hypothetical protein [Planctomycetota bacterium]
MRVPVPSVAALLVSCVAATVTSGAVNQGAYTLALAGKRVGSYLVGTFEARLGDKAVRTGRFSGTLREAD